MAVVDARVVYRYHGRTTRTTLALRRLVVGRAGWRSGDNDPNNSPRPFRLRKIRPPRRRTIARMKYGDQFLHCDALVCSSGFASANDDPSCAVSAATPLRRAAVPCRPRWRSWSPVDPAPVASGRKRGSPSPRSTLAPPGCRARIPSLAAALIFSGMSARSKIPRLEPVDAAAGGLDHDDRTPLATEEVGRLDAAEDGAGPEDRYIARLAAAGILVFACRSGSGRRAGSSWPACGCSGRSTARRSGTAGRGPPSPHPS